MQKMFVMGAFFTLSPAMALAQSPCLGGPAGTTKRHISHRYRKRAGTSAALSASSASNRAGNPTIKFPANVSPKFFSAQLIENAPMRGFGVSR